MRMRRLTSAPRPSDRVAPYICGTRKRSIHCRHPHEVRTAVASGTRLCNKLHLGEVRRVRPEAVSHAVVPREVAAGLRRGDDVVRGEAHGEGRERHLLHGRTQGLEMLGGFPARGTIHLVIVHKMGVGTLIMRTVCEGGVGRRVGT